ncbi:MAG TPA: hypothetical protein VIM00_06405 [Candidatus Acidoferrum sp.]
MLRISIQEEPQKQTILLEGKIAGPWVEEFDRAWRTLDNFSRLKELQLDLRGVAFVDENGRKLLRHIYDETHASFLTNSPLTRYFAEEAMHKSSATL